MKINNQKYLDDKERDLDQAINEMDISRLEEPTDKVQKKYKTAAKKHLENGAKMNIRIDPAELEKIKKVAETQGLKYQTFVKSVLHKYVTGQLVERDK